MKPFNHWRSGLYWGFGTMSKRTGRRTAAGPFCYLVRTEAGEIERWEGGFCPLPDLCFDEQVRAERIE